MVAEFVERRSNGAKKRGNERKLIAQYHCCHPEERFWQRRIPTEALRKRDVSSLHRFSASLLPCFIFSHSFVVRAASALRHSPIDNLVRVGDVARLAMDAIREIDLQFLRGALSHHFVYRRGAEILAR